ncbi:nucleotidyltransferase family protein [Metabacillus endolithicus]|uniref:Nucleotidyltransferase family protein n=1 Tax=Metabacillus endolithicus TaxID=1535204 RepID=A0ABW5BYV6_9BACI
MVNQKILKLDNVSAEVKLILHLLKQKSHEDTIENLEKLLGDINWTLFIDQVKHHRVYPVLFPILNKCTHQLIPPFVIQRLRMDYQRNIFYMLQISAEMERINRVLSEENIRVLFLKGPIIAHDLYGDISLRTSCDLDFLIPINELDKVEQTLLKHGYLKDDYIRTILDDWKWRHHHVTYFHPKTKTKLEVHWRLNPGPGFEPSFEELWQTKKQSDLTTSPVYFLGREHLFLFLVTHGSRHGWSRLRWLLDIHQIIEKAPNWKKVYNLLKKYHLEHIGAQALILNHTLLNSNIDSTHPYFFKNSKSGYRLAQDAIFYLERMVNLHTDPVPFEVSKFHKQHLFSLMSLRQKILFLLSTLHPYPEDAEKMPLPKSLHLLYFPLRPFLWAWRKKSKQALS